MTSKKGRKNENLNLKFYLDEVPSDPNGDYITKIHSEWAGDYGRLESHHGYIQWLFPLYEGNGVNWHAQTLQRKEAKLMRENMIIGERVMKSYEMMLDFYGMEIADKTTGEGMKIG